MKFLRLLNVLKGEMSLSRSKTTATKIGRTMYGVLDIKNFFGLVRIKGCILNLLRKESKGIG